MPSKTTTPVRQKAAAKKAVSAKAKKAYMAEGGIGVNLDEDAPVAKDKPARDRSRWNNLVKGTKVKLKDGRTGICAYFHSHYEKDKAGKDIKSKPVGFVGVLIDAKAGAPAQVGGRKVKHVSVAAADLTVIK